MFPFFRFLSLLFLTILLSSCGKVAKEPEKRKNSDRLLPISQDQKSKVTIKISFDQLISDIDNESQATLLQFIQSALEYNKGNESFKSQLNDNELIIIPAKAYKKSDKYCRDFNIYFQDKVSQSTACRTDNGRWDLINTNNN
jgi:hypothetical protein